MHLESIEEIYNKPVLDKAKAYTVLETLAIRLTKPYTDELEYVRNCTSFISICNRLAQKYYTISKEPDEEPSLKLFTTFSDNGALTDTYLNIVSPKNADGYPIITTDSSNIIEYDENDPNNLITLKAFLFAQGFKQIDNEKFNDRYLSKLL